MKWLVSSYKTREGSEDYDLSQEQICNADKTGQADEHQVLVP